MNGDAGPTVGGVIMYVLLVGLYITPMLVAAFRRCGKIGPVVVINMLLGWTFIGWVVALAMAVSGPGKRSQRYESR